ncbi:MULTISPECIES: hypothetical protein [unclassified Variovorax]|uniref:hypothetical protein n=1 Tax=unclassified Variovorax TaxID=663243 RepID=UPI00076DD612|nr:MULTISPECIES: hypothetical protein [unclassified Variovorax]KWT98466.1 hypothetical protein APY03_0601 [Variovorax sp. WDL1]PNG49861.1 hypothetical protein CHC06_05442 [Variovorax sp. B2]PNG50733.1 hypothetical protein CHC07_05347 [Variovorax sp. B4]VTV17941.1 hypothetical protein WDL1P1_00782 [Variovorax sp. WDL1]
MNQDSNTGLSVRYLLTVQGQPEELEVFVTSVRHPTDGDKLFQPSRAVPVPAGLEAVDPFAIPYYHFIQNQYRMAAEALEALNEEPNLVALLKDPAKHQEARVLLNRTLDTEALAGVALVRKNVRQYNALTRAQWAQKNWGQFDDRLTCAQFERVTNRRGQYHFTWHTLDVRILDQLGALHPTLAFGLVGVDELNLKQAYGWHCEGSSTFHHGAGAVDPGRPTWLDHLPAAFSVA